LLGVTTLGWMDGMAALPIRDRSGVLVDCARLACDGRGVSAGLVENR
jgi:hypothetical protein